MGRKWAGGEYQDNAEYFEAQSCGTKRRYPNRAAAKAGRAAMSERLGVYGPCSFCGGWHIGHRDGKDNSVKFRRRRKRLA